MKGKLRVEFIKSLGFMFAIGDEYEYIIDSKFEFLVDQDYLDLVNYKEDFNNRFITHFADRSMTNGQFTEGLVKLPSDFPVQVYCSEDKHWVSGKKNDFYFGKTSTDSTITKWKPDYEALIEMQKEYDNEMASKSISDTLDKMAESIGMFRQVAEEPTLSTDIINWTDEAQYALVGEGGEVVLCEYHPKVEVYFGMEVYTYSGTCYKNGYYTLIKREEKEAVKLTSKDIDWEDEMNYAVVRKDNNTYTSKQYDVVPKKSLSFLGDDMYDFDGHMYNSDYYYIITREQETMEELLYTKVMKDKGELPKAGMKCEYYGDKCDVIGTTTGNMVVIENPCGGIIVCSLDNIKPIETEQERIDKLKSDQRETVCKVLSNSTRGFLSPSYFDKGVKELQDNGLLASVSDSNKS